LAAQHVAGLPLDGQTLLVAGGSEFVALLAFREARFDPRRSFRAIIRLTRQPLFIVGRHDDAATSLRQLVGATSERPGEVSYSSSGIGSIYHALFVLLESASGTEFVRAPFPSGGLALQALPAVTVRLTGLTPGEVGGLVEARQTRLFGVASAARLSGFPDLPTLKEMGWDVQVEGMKGLSAPAGLPDAAATSLHDRFRGAMQTSSWRTFIERTGAIEGYLDGPSFQSKMTRMMDELRAALRPA
jgi:tripartite-type tricarboxylate transporter receptor subunit TctC